MSSAATAIPPRSWVSYLPERVQAPASYIGSAMEALLTPTINTLRIDQSIKAFYQDRSWKNLMGIGGYSFSWICLAGSAHCMGFAYTLPMTIIFNYGLAKVLQNKQAQQAPYFPLRTAAKHIALGIVLGYGFFHINRCMTRAIDGSFLAMGFSSLGKQEVVVVAQSPTLSGSLMGLFGSIVGPSLEECIFRGILLEDDIPKEQSEQKGTCEKIKKIVGSSLFFGILHITPSQGWSNISMFIMAPLVGGVLGTLRVATGDLWAPVAAHMVNNAIVLYKLV